MRSRPPETEAGRGAFRLLKTGAERGEPRPPRAGNGKRKAESRKRKAERRKQETESRTQNAEREKRHPGIQTGRSDLNGSDRLFDEYELRGYFSGESGSRAITR